MKLMIRAAILAILSLFVFSSCSTKPDVIDPERPEGAYHLNFRGIDGYWEDDDAHFSLHQSHHSQSGGFVWGLSMGWVDPPTNHPGDAFFTLFMNNAIEEVSQ